MGDVDRLPSGKWQARWRDDTGRQRKQSFRTKAMATQHLSDVAHDKARGVYLDERGGRKTVTEFAKEWANAQPHRPATARRVASGIRVHIESQPIGSMPLAAVRRTHVQAWVTSRSQVLAPSSTKLAFTLLRAVLNAAVEDRLISVNPARKVALPQISRARVVPLTVEQVRALSGAMPAAHRAMVVVQAGLGLRLGELLALRVEDVDFLRRTVRIEHQIRPFDRVRVEPKTHRARRRVPLPQMVADTLAAHLGAYPSGPDGTIFQTHDGRPWRQEQYANRLFRKAVETAELPVGTSSHDLRHHYVSLLIDAGASVVEVAALIGDSPAIVMDTYAHLMPGREERARTMVDSAWRAPDVPGEEEKGL